ncbi:curculin-1-like [Apium graveolens]|uniref:curculin-1-like n=1 Tax=Apium graveolens TaxID=4045 RepID=UPI003D7AAC9E
MVMVSSLRCYMLIVLLVLTSNSALHVSAIVSLFTNQSLRVNEQLINRSFSLSMQGDCNLVLRDGTRVLWSTNTSGYGTNCRVTMQDDGNLVVYNDQGALWASNSWRQGRDSYELILQEDRNLVIYKGSARTPIWDTKTYFLASE